MRIPALFVLCGFFFLGLAQGAAELFVAEGLAVEFTFFDFHLEADVTKIEQGTVDCYQEEQKKQPPITEEVRGRGAQAFHVYAEVGHARACGEANRTNNTPAALGQHVLHPGAATQIECLMVNVLPTRVLHRSHQRRYAACAFPSARLGTWMLGVVRTWPRANRKHGANDFHPHGHRSMRR